MRFPPLALLLVAALAVILPLACSGTPPPCPYLPRGSTTQACRVCVQRDGIVAGGEAARVPSFSRDAEPEPGDWSGATLPEEMPATRLYVRCRPCTCNAHGQLEPYDAWRAINARSYARLRTARAPYPVAIVPGFHNAPLVARYRVRKALQLLQHGWIAAIILSGGHRRGGHNEGGSMVDMANELAAQLGVDVRDRLFVEPCACKSATNVRDSLRMMAALRLPRGVLVTETRLTGQGNIFALDFDGLVQRDLQCYVGRMSFLRGPVVSGPPGDPDGCRPPLSLTRNPFTLVVPRREAVLYWVSPFGRMPDGVVHSTLECNAGADRIAECEPDNERDDGPCLPMVGRTDLSCGAAGSNAPEVEADAGGERGPGSEAIESGEDERANAVVNGPDARP